jgi:hypothetical protein
VSRVITDKLFDDRVSLRVGFLFPLHDFFYGSVATGTDSAIIFTGCATR